MTSKPLFVDGPLKAQDLEVPEQYLKQRQFTWIVDKPISGPLAKIAPPNPRVTYHLHQFALLGHRILLWSTQRSFSEIAFNDLRDLFDVMISERAKLAEDK